MAHQPWCSYFNICAIYDNLQVLNPEDENEDGIQALFLCLDGTVVMISLNTI